MESKVTLSVEVVLTLNAAEAGWLHGVMQNTLYDQEHSEDRIMREKFFKATDITVETLYSSEDSKKPNLFSGDLSKG